MSEAAKRLLESAHKNSEPIRAMYRDWPTRSEELVEYVLEQIRKERSARIDGNGDTSLANAFGFMDLFGPGGDYGPDPEPPKPPKPKIEVGDRLVRIYPGPGDECHVVSRKSFDAIREWEGDK